MLIKTKCFGEIDIAEDMIIEFADGLMGFEDLKRYTILYNNEEGKKSSISWLQSVDEPALALPIINPFLVKEDYNPVVEDELLKPLGDINEENLAVFLVLTVPSDLTKMTANLKAPLLVNADTKKGQQVIVENQDYVVKYNVYDVLKKKKDGGND
ncbi:MAG: flagellar assembly protein FliW [Lachnospiraceae bacterium]|nr:flagellar assembly protein FliW [Lachnospiraceae bacterium]